MNFFEYMAQNGASNAFIPGGGTTKGLIIAQNDFNDWEDFSKHRFYRDRENPSIYYYKDENGNMYSNRGEVIHPDGTTSRYDINEFINGVVNQNKDRLAFNTPENKRKVFRKYGYYQQEQQKRIQDNIHIYDGIPTVYDQMKRIESDAKVRLAAIANGAEPHSGDGLYAYGRAHAPMIRSDIRIGDNWVITPLKGDLQYGKKIYGTSASGKEGWYDANTVTIGSDGLLRKKPSKEEAAENEARYQISEKPKSTEISPKTRFNSPNNVQNTLTIASLPSEEELRLNQRAISYNKKYSKKQAMELQKILNQAGFHVGTIDGIIGNDTINAIKAFQKSKGLTVDGMIGDNTLSALSEANALRPKYSMVKGIDRVYYKPVDASSVQIKI